MPKLNIYDISKLAGVSISTVSRVLNGADNVRPETRKNVESVIQKYSYSPKQTNRNFNKKKQYMVGILTDDTRHAYMSELAYTISRELTKDNASTILSNIDDVSCEFLSQIDILLEKKVDVIILLGSIFEEEICKIALEHRYSGYSFVAVNAGFSLPNVCEIMQDQQFGMAKAIQHLVSLGRTKIGWIYYHHSHSDQNKYKGFEEGMMLHNLSMERRIESNGKTLEEGFRTTKELLNRWPDTDAIIYSGDILAVGGAHFLNDNDIRIPEEIAVIGFNNSHLAEECYPPLTSVDNRIAETGRAAAKAALSIIHNNHPESVMLPCSLSIRQSTVK